ncbi:MAG TPA: hypothetical protein VMT46_10855 [Anaerolineaceae bacterium]|nr:hypothetical protein [Anaerolineaceae bacterium]
MTEVTEAKSTPLYCANHPNIETSLRCNRCERPICTKCAVLTPTGYRCKDCVRGIQKTYDTAEAIDYPIAFIVAGILSFLGSLIAQYLGFFVIFLAPIAGVIVAEAVRTAIRKHRSRSLYQIATIGAAVGSLFPILPRVLGILLLYSGGNLGGSLGVLLPLVWAGLYTFIITSTVYYRLAGIQIR